VGETDDAPLVQAARQGDKAAFGELISRHVRTAEALAGRVLQDRDLARDAVQEAVVLALIGLDRLHAPDRFGAWLAGIALNVARRWVRRSVAHSVQPQQDGPDPGPGPDEEAERALLRERVHRAVAGLAPGQRNAVYLFYLQGLTHR
jgi:RNA polymerase sigma factor (sigma-70 family)